MISLSKFLTALTLTLFITTMTNAKESLDEIMEVLKYVETGNDPTLIGDKGTSYGVLQIQEAVVIDVNRRYGTHYTHEDMFQVECAEEVFKLYAQMGIERYCTKYGKEATAEVIIRNHNGGIYQGYRINATKKYYRRYKLWKAILNSRDNLFTFTE